MYSYYGPYISKKYTKLCKIVILFLNRKIYLYNLIYINYIHLKISDNFKLISNIIYFYT